MPFFGVVEVAEDVEDVADEAAPGAVEDVFVVVVDVPIEPDDEPEPADAPNELPAGEPCVAPNEEPVPVREPIGCVVRPTRCEP